MTSPRRMPRLESAPVIRGSVIGIIANPMSGRDIRRVVSQASVFSNTEKASMVLRILRTVGTLGAERVLLSTDTAGIAARVRREMDRMSGPRLTLQVRWPRVEFVELERPTGTAADTTSFARAMTLRSASAVALLGGDGTMRAAVSGLGDTPMLAMSTGTNNAFPVMIEATVAGVALGMVATGTAPSPLLRAKLLHIDVTRANSGLRQEVALVDACISTLNVVGSRALWNARSLRELYCTFSEPYSIGLSSIAAQIRTVGRYEPRGIALRLEDPAGASQTILAPLAPGLLEPVGVVSARSMEMNIPHAIVLDQGTIALDGEREIQFGPLDEATVTLAQDGPRVIDVPTVLAAAAINNPVTDLTRTDDQLQIVC